MSSEVYFPIFSYLDRNCIDLKLELVYLINITIHKAYQNMM